MQMIDLKQFCSTDDLRATLRRPFSHGAFSYATNGVIAVRVPRRPDIPEADKAKIPEQLDKILSPLDGAAFKAIDIRLPDDEEITTKEQCGDCTGSGHEHDCPDCTCECTACDGSGVVEETAKISVAAFGDIYRLPYLRQALALPGVEIADLPRSLSEPALFRFEEGVAALMLMRAEHRLHVVANPALSQQERR
jgi:hypothetical protein